MQETVFKKPAHLIKKLKKLGFEFDRKAAGFHEIWFNPATEKYTTIPNHPGDMLKAILKQADITTNQFLEAYRNNDQKGRLYLLFSEIS